ncbi:hypothetical protein Chor_001948 [Crotalus horridus]
MAAPVLLRQSKRLASLSVVSSRLSSTSGGLSSSPRKGGIFHFLTSRFYDIESFVEISQKLKRWKMEKGNKYDVDLHERYGGDIGAAIFVLKLQGAIRASPERPGGGVGVGDPDVADSHSLPLQQHLCNLTGLKHLDLSRCSFIDDWCLSQLHPFAESLQTLSLAGCSRITEKGLTCLHHFQNLERLDVSSLPSVPHPLLIRILLEEMLPQCYIVGMDNHENMDFPTQREKERTF